MQPSTPLNRQPNLEGPTLRIRPLIADDWEGLFAVAADPLIWAQHPAHDRWRRDVFAGYFAEARASGGGVVVIERATGAIVGASRYQPLQSSGNDIEIGWSFLARRLWGGPANREKKTLMLDHAFGAVESVVFKIGAENMRSRRAVEKLGGVFEADFTRPDGGPGVLYRLNKSVWAAQRG
jgi:N-acetyltransferase